MGKGEAWLLGGEDLDWRPVKVTEGKKVDETKFEIVGEEGTYRFRATDTPEWVEAIEGQ